MKQGYRAFISYCQKDKKWAKKIHRQLESYSVPEGIEIPGLDEKRRIGRVFRDDDELAGAPSLGKALEDAIDSTETLVVICSPNAAQSHWVNEEIKRFKSRKTNRRVLAVIVEGLPNSGDPDTECFPEALRYKVSDDGEITDIPDEPLAPDLTKEGFFKVKVRLLAGILNITFDSLFNREYRLRRRRITIVTLFTLLLTVIIVLAGSLLYLRAEKFRQAERVSRTSALVAQGDRAQNVGSARVAELKYKQALEIDEDPSTRIRLRNALTSGLHMNLSMPNQGIQKAFFSRTGNRLFVIKTDKVLAYKLDGSINGDPIQLQNLPGQHFALNGAHDNLLRLDRSGNLTRIEFHFDKQPRSTSHLVSKLHDAQCDLVSSIESNAYGDLLFVRGQDYSDYEHTCIFNIATRSKIKTLTHQAPWSWTTQQYEFIETTAESVTVVEGAQVQGGVSARIKKPQNMNSVGVWNESAGPLREIFESDAKVSRSSDNNERVVDIIVVGRNEIYCAGKLTALNQAKLKSKYSSCDWRYERSQTDSPFSIDALHRGIVEETDKGYYFFDVSTQAFSRLRDLPVQSEAVYAVILSPVKRILIENKGRIELWSSESYDQVGYKHLDLIGDELSISKDMLSLQTFAESHSQKTMVDLHDGRVRTVMHRKKQIEKEGSPFVDWNIEGSEREDNGLDESMPSIILPCDVLGSQSFIGNDGRQYALVEVENCQNDEGVNSYLITENKNKKMISLPLPLLEPVASTTEVDTLIIQGLKNESLFLLKIDVENLRIENSIELLSGWASEGGTAQVYGGPNSVLEHTRYYDRLGLKEEVLIHDGKGGSILFEKMKEGYPEDKLFTFALQDEGDFIALVDELTVTIVDGLKGTLQERDFENKIDVLTFCGDDLWIVSGGELYQVPVRSLGDDDKLNFDFLYGALIEKFSCSPNGKMLAISWDDGAVSLYSTEKKEPVYFLQASNKISNFRFSSDSNQFILIENGDKKRVRIWRVAEWQ